VQFGYLLACTTLFYTCWGIYSMAWTAMGYELTDDYHERSRVQGIGGLFLTIVLVVNGWIYWLALRPMFGDGAGTPYHHTGVRWIYDFLVRQITGDPAVHSNEITGIRWIASIIAVIAVAAAMVCVRTCKERFSHANPRKNHIALLPAMKATLKNRPFVILLLQRSFGILGGRICGGVAGFLGIYYVCYGNKDLAFKVGAIGGTMSMVFGLSLMPFMKHFSKLLGKRKALIMGATLGLIGALLAPLITLPGHPWLPLIPGLIFMPLGIIAGTLGDALLPDICDYDELECGQHREGLFTAVMAFFSKIEMSAAALGVGYLIVWTGYSKGLPMQSDLTINRMWWLAIVPNIFCSAIGLLLILKFPMTEATMAEVRRQLDERRAMAAALKMEDEPITEGFGNLFPGPAVFASLVETSN
jgi:GPH family glycoside/pentoside/hexuronide:cation symporter